MPTQEPGLLFVNKTSRSKSLTNSRDDTEGLRQIQQHAQKSRDYEKEKEQKRRLRRSKLPVGWAPISSASTKPPASDHPGIHSATPKVEKDALTEEDGHVANIATTDEPEDGRSDLAIMTPEGASVEPFGQFKISMNTEKYRILEYFALRYFPAVTRLDVAHFMGRSESASSNSVTHWVRDALVDEVHVLALISAASARLKYVDRSPFSRPDLPEQLADRALRLMRRYLEQGRPVNQQLIRSIQALWTFESYKRNWEGVNAHRSMLLYLTDTYLGGFQNLEPYTRRMIWFADRFHAAATQTPPVIEDRWETNDLTPQQYKGVINAIRAHGRQPMALGFTQATEFFSADFQKLLQRVRELCCVIQCRWIGVSEQFRIPDRDWAVGRAWAISDELISLKNDALQQSCSRYRRLQDCVRLALIAWLAFVPASEHLSPGSRDMSAPTVRAAIDARPLRARLAGILEMHSEQPPSLSEHVLLFWISALGAVASELIENQEWFAVHFQALARQLEIYTWEDFMPINERYF